MLGETLAERIGVSANHFGEAREVDTPVSRRGGRLHVDDVDRRIVAGNLDLLEARTEAWARSRIDKGRVVRDKFEVPESRERRDEMVVLLMCRRAQQDGLDALQDAPEAHPLRRGQVFVLSVASRAAIGLQ